MPESPPGVAFRHANFRYYLMVRVLTTTASEMQAVAVAWQVYALTHRPLDLGLVGLGQFLPGILLFLVAGQTADRFARQRILQACCGGFALCSLMLLGLTWHGLFSVFPIYGVLLLNGIARAFNGPASQAFLPLLVTEEHFPKAVAWNSSIFQAATIAGPVAGGLLYGWTASPPMGYGCAAREWLSGAVGAAGTGLAGCFVSGTSASNGVLLSGPQLPSARNHSAGTLIRRFPDAVFGVKRSEEHTSELQSPCNLVCRLLLEKTKMSAVSTASGGWAGLPRRSPPWGAGSAQCGTATGSTGRSASTCAVKDHPTLFF